VDCVTAAARCRRSVESYGRGDLVQVEGVLRRRFARTDAAGTSRLEVEVLKTRRLQRAQA
jgi:single-strand DNA-binding protein